MLGAPRGSHAGAVWCMLRLITHRRGAEHGARQSRRLRSPKSCTSHSRFIIARALKVLGQDRCVEILADVLTIESNGGLWLKDRSRRRTSLGGTFLQLVKRAGFTGGAAYNFR